jgi:hypothetical protein
MMTDLIFKGNPFELMIAILAILLLSIEIPYQWGIRSEKLSKIDESVWNMVQGALLTLVAFMLALSYAQAQARFDARRALVVKEANSIGTTWLRADQLTPRDTVVFRRILTQYTRERLEAYSTPGRPDLYARVIRDSDWQQAEMWGLASRALRERPTDLGRSLLMATLNDTIDVSAEQLTALSHHVPTSVILLTFILVVVSSITIGLRFAHVRSRPVILTILYAIALTLVLNLVIDYDRPQVGFVTVSLDALTIQLRAMEP